jgi:hypothetical protein
MSVLDRVTAQLRASARQIDRANDTHSSKRLAPATSAMTCDACNGTGLDAAGECSRCSGEGKLYGVVTVEQGAFWFTCSEGCAVHPDGGHLHVAGSAKPKESRKGRTVVSLSAMHHWEQCGCPPHPVFSPDAWRTYAYHSNGVRKSQAELYRDSPAQLRAMTWALLKGKTA